VNKGQGFGKGQNGKGAANKGSATKPTQGQPNTMEAKYERLEALITSMVAQMKSTASKPKKAKDREDGQSYGSKILLWNWFFNINNTISNDGTYVKRSCIMGNK